MKKLSLFDRKFLAACKISTAVDSFDDAKFLSACGIRTDPEPAPAPDEIDETCEHLLAEGIPVTAENWMRLNFAGNPPAIGEVDGEILAELPRWVRAVYDPDFEPDEEED